MENSPENGVEGKQQQAAAEGQFECRLLIPSKMAGSIIGWSANLFFTFIFL
jgi:hypothetical protein